MHNPFAGSQITKLGKGNKIKNPPHCGGFLLAYLDSNQDKQNQNLSYYHYTIGQSPFRGLQK
jgi:hypothetical protein